MRCTHEMRCDTELRMRNSWALLLCDLHSRAQKHLMTLYHQAQRYGIGWRKTFLPPCFTVGEIMITSESLILNRKNQEN